MKKTTRTDWDPPPNKDYSDDRDYSPIISRILEYATSINMKKGAFEKSIGKSEGYFNKVQNPGSDVIADIVRKYPEVNGEWLATGEGTMIKPELDITSTPMGRDTLPVFDTYGRAGRPELVNAQENVNILEYITVPGYSDCVGWVKVKGSSMSGLIEDGEYVAIKIATKDRVLYSQVYYIVFGGDFPPEPIIKYIRKGSSKDYWTLRSHNPNWEDVEVKISDIQSVFMVKIAVNIRDIQ